MTEIMNGSGLELHKISPIRVWDHKDNGTWTLPSLDHVEVIPTLWLILNEIDRDWKNYAAHYSYSALKNPDIDKAVCFVHAVDELKPKYILCLFSYINFFFTLENGLSIFYDELKDLKDELSLRLKIANKPKRVPYIEKLRLVRNNTVVHWGGPDKKHDLDSKAGRLWGFSLSTSVDDLTYLEFGSSSIVGAKDRTLKSLPETHDICIGYLKQYDALCADLLNRIVNHLPMKLGDREYVHTNPSA
jgi:hypothetical protein